MGEKLGPAGRKIEWVRLHPDYSQGVHGTVLKPKEVDSTQTITLLPKDDIQRSLRWLTANSTKKGALIGFVCGLGLDILSVTHFGGSVSTETAFYYGFFTLFPTLLGISSGFGLAQDRDGWAKGNYRLVDKNQSPNVKA